MIHFQVAELYSPKSPSLPNVRRVAGVGGWLHSAAKARYHSPLYPQHSEFAALREIRYLPVVYHPACSPAVRISRRAALYTYCYASDHQHSIPKCRSDCMRLLCMTIHNQDLWDTARCLLPSSPGTLVLRSSANLSRSYSCLSRWDQSYICYTPVRMPRPK